MVRKSRAVARHGAVNDIVSFAFLAGCLLKHDPILRPHSVTDDVEDEYIPGTRLRYSLEKHGNAGHLGPVD